LKVETDPAKQPRIPSGAASDTHNRGRNRAESADQGEGPIKQPISEAIGFETEDHLELLTGSRYRKNVVCAWGRAGFFNDRKSPIQQPSCAHISTFPTLAVFANSQSRAYQLRETNAEIRGGCLKPSKGKPLEDWGTSFIFQKKATNVFPPTWNSR